ncbi:hypothetical protein N658DRAFT_495874 [Parathielavia hyrcaniae]|uniref:Secreted protein n=1 Tax=Parathielavia hyrcaniae TaxID=113614 RepID=A0AAN6T2J5_9PEZI|nr:hypothetical protein N658DRAFT_495874 [Parathielavia hyrcaniae]
MNLSLMVIAVSATPTASTQPQSNPSVSFLGRDPRGDSAKLEASDPCLLWYERDSAMYLALLSKGYCHLMALYCVASRLV